MIDHYAAALGHHLFEIAATENVHAIPAHAQPGQLGKKVAPLLHFLGTAFLLLPMPGAAAKMFRFGTLWEAAKKDLLEWQNVLA